MKSIFELAENLSLVLTKLDTELGLAQPQLVFYLNWYRTRQGLWHVRYTRSHKNSEVKQHVSVLIVGWVTVSAISITVLATTKNLN